MQTVRWSEEATTDLVEIIDYIEQRNAAAAQNLYAAINLLDYEGIASDARRAGGAGGSSAR